MWYWYGIGFDAHESFWLFNGSGFGKNVSVCGADMSSSLHINNSNRKDIFILGKSSTYGFDDVTLTAEKRYAINFTEQQKQFCLSLH